MPVPGRFQTINPATGEPGPAWDGHTPDEATAILGQLAQLFRVRDLEGEWLLDVHVLARFEQDLRERVVPHGRGRDDDALDLGIRRDLLHIRDRLDAGILRGGLGEALRVRVAHRDEARARKIGEVAHEIRAPVTGADDCDSDTV